MNVLLSTIWLASDLLLGRSLGVGERGWTSIVILRLLVQAALMVESFILVARRFKGHRRYGSKASIPELLYVVAFGLFLFSAGVGAIVGADFHSWTDFRYWASDVIKVVMFAWLCLAISTVSGTRELARIWIVCAAAAAIAVLKELALYGTVLQPGERVASLYAIPVLIMCATVWLFVSRGARGLRWVVAVVGWSGFVALLWLSQSLSLVVYLAALVTAGAAVMLVGSRGWRRMAIFTLAALVMVGVVGLIVNVEKIATAIEDTYIGTKLSRFVDSEALPIAVIAVGGDRLLYPLTVGRIVVEEPIHALVGQGAGAMIELVPAEELGAVSRAKWLEERHYFESAYAELIYRYGFMALIGFVLIHAVPLGALIAARDLGSKSPWDLVAGGILGALLLLYSLNVGFPLEGFGTPLLIALAQVWGLARFREANLAARAHRAAHL